MLYHPGAHYLQQKCVTLGKKIAICQSNYIPWKGYFDLINSADIFVIYDTEQYTKRDWRNRNLIQTPNGPKWLTIPVQNQTFHQKIEDTIPVDSSWQTKHWKSIVLNYGKARYFSDYKGVFEHIYQQDNLTSLSKINYEFILAICNLLKIRTTLMWSSQFDLPEGRNQKILYICKTLNALTYISGPKAKNYLDENLFNQNGMTVNWMNYSRYPEYAQRFLPFEQGVSILDMIFNLGPDTQNYMKSFK